ncbi:hypothetical protein CROQUDRAFT_670801 [Cronartium quercuum f. sp. fusiforme G11]|uniref:C2H2-type domain-containing protein n=1 Tax=Cronartium quercuum f. sp. fusiforme G11 TaxID=708437 RepID=A0A9P6TC61_9BASI|nr:hypothetical protein CROQUDRAFT_670801 [Cronartium quercuum f. sp. fusiforme G11]
MESYLVFEQPSYNDSVNAAPAAWTHPQQEFPIDMNIPRMMTGQNYSCGPVVPPCEELMAIFSPYQTSWAALESQIGQPNMEVSSLPMAAWPSNDIFATEQAGLPFDSPTYAQQQSYPLPLSYPPPPMVFAKSPSTVASSPSSNSQYESQSGWSMALARQQSSSSSVSSPSQGSQLPTKRYGCQICGRAFQRQTTLTQHQITHTGERPYGCPVAGCDKAFTTASNAKRHAKTHYRTPLHHAHHGTGLYRSSF